MEYKIKPWAHQLKAIELAKDRNEFALFFEQGCGKTSTLINILRHKYEKKANGLISTLILCPVIVLENWKREFEAHSDIPPWNIHILTGSGFDRLCDFERFIEPAPGRIVITNYESLLMEALFKKKLLPWAPQIVVLDESHKCKDLSAKRTKRVVELGDRAHSRFILSGTPIINSAFDIYSQFRFLDGGETFGKSFWAFRNEYFVDKNQHKPRHAYFPNWVIRPGALQEINKKVYTKAMRVTKAEALDLPPLVRQIVDVELSGEQKRAYDQLEVDAVSYFNGAEMSADLAITKALRLQQLVTGFFKADDGTTHVFDKNPRIAALEEVLDNIGPDHKVIIWAVFKHNYADIRRLLDSKNIGHVSVTGEQTTEEKQRAVDLFNKPGNTARVLIGHPASGGIGVNLTIADYSIFYSRGFSLENDLQAEARNHRGGSERHQSITRIDLVAPGTTDEIVLTALSAKQDVSEAILKYMKGGYE